MQIKGKWGEERLRGQKGNRALIELLLFFLPPNPLGASTHYPQKVKAIFFIYRTVSKIEDSGAPETSCLEGKGPRMVFVA